MSYLLLKQNLIKVNIVSNVVSSTNWTTACVDNTRNCYMKKRYNKCYNSGVHPLEPAKHSPYSHRNFPFSPNKFWWPVLVFYLPILTSPVLVSSQHSFFYPLPIFGISHSNLTHLYCSKNYLPLKCQFPLKTFMMNISASSPPMEWPPLLHCCLIYLRVQATCDIVCIPVPCNSPMICMTWAFKINIVFKNCKHEQHHKKYCMWHGQ